MARTLIRLSGFVPDQDIAITFTGLRPGEKLYEELVGNRESVEPSGVEKITKIKRGESPDPVRLDEQLADLRRLADDPDPARLLSALQSLVPTYTPFSAD